jgi:hypothetical protein
MLSAQQQEFFSTTDRDSSLAWRSNVSKTRELLATLRQILSGEGTVSLEFGADDAWRLSVEGIIFSDRRFLGSYQQLGRAWLILMFVAYRVAGEKGLSPRRASKLSFLFVSEPRSAKITPSACLAPPDFIGTRGRPRAQECRLRLKRRKSELRNILI